MKKQSFLLLAVMGLAMCGLSTQAALLPVSKDSGSPYYADFSIGSGLSVSYKAGTGVFTASGTSLAYTSGYDSWGTGKAATGVGSGTHGEFNGTGFNGSYLLSANIAKDSSGNWYVSGGTVTIDGDLLGGTSSSVLLMANLKTGAAGAGTANGTLGYGGSGSTLFDFLFTVSGGNSAIVSDFFGSGTGQGAIIINAYGYNTIGYSAFSGNFNTSFNNTYHTSFATADTFVPEPAAYPLAASVTALLAFAGFGISRRKQVKIAIGK